MAEGEMGGVCSIYEMDDRCKVILVGKPKGTLLMRHWHRWEDNIRMDFKEVIM
jgi:hypothetical protein